MASTCRVMQSPAAVVTRPRMVLRIWVLAVTLRVSASLLRTRTWGRIVRVWVTETCRCRLFEKPSLCSVIGVLQFLGTASTKLRVLVVVVVVISLLRLVLG